MNLKKVDFSELSNHDIFGIYIPKNKDYVWLEKIYDGTAIDPDSRDIYSERQIRNMGDCVVENF
jgi:hypothetical protein